MTHHTRRPPGAIASSGRTMSSITRSCFFLIVTLNALCLVGGGPALRKAAITSAPESEVPQVKVVTRIPERLHNILSKLGNSSQDNASGLDVTHSQNEAYIPATNSSPGLICQKVTGQNGNSGLLCKTISTNSTVSPEVNKEKATKSLKDLARDVKKEAQIFEKHLPLHRVSDMYHWQYSSTFVFVSNRRHYYNVHYADSSALKIKTGQDVVQIGPYRVMSRFGLIEEAVSGMPGQDLQGADGILGFGYSDWQRSASLMKTMTRRSRPSWHVTQPPGVPILDRNIFSVLTSETAGELQLGGYDPASYEGELMWTKMMNQTGYGVLITGLSYNGVEVLDLGDEGKRVGGVMGVFDTGSTCMEFPKGLFKGYYKTSLFDNFAALASKDPSHPILITLLGGKVLSLPPDIWSEPWGCTNAFEADNVLLLGHHVFKSYIVVHDMSVPEYRMGFAPVSKAYAPKIGLPGPLKVPPPGGVAKIALVLLPRVHLFITVAIGTPPQPFRCVFDTGSILLAVFSGNVTGKLVNDTRREIQLMGNGGGWTWMGVHIAAWYLEVAAVTCCLVTVVVAAVRLRRVISRRTAARRRAAANAGAASGGYVDYGASSGGGARSEAVGRGEDRWKGSDADPNSVWGGTPKGTAWN